MPTPDQLLHARAARRRRHPAADACGSSRICIAPMRDLARHTIMSARSRAAGGARGDELPLALRPARRPRLRRLLRGARSVPPARRRTRSRSARARRTGIVGEDRPRLPLVVAEEVIGRSFLARAMAAIDDPGEAERLEAALMVLVNKVLAAGRAKPGQAEVVRRGALYATATLSLGLETRRARRPRRARPQALRSIALAPAVPRRLHGDAEARAARAGARAALGDRGLAGQGAGRRAVLAAPAVRARRRRAAGGRAAPVRVAGGSAPRRRAAHRAHAADRARRGPRRRRRRDRPGARAAARASTITSAPRSRARSSAASCAATRCRRPS